MNNTTTWKSLATIIHVPNAVFYHAKRLDKMYPAIHESCNIRVSIIVVWPMLFSLIFADV